MVSSLHDLIQVARRSLSGLRMVQLTSFARIACPLVCGTLVCGTLFIGSAHAELNSAQKRLVSQVTSQINAAAKAYRDKDYREARMQLGQARRIYDRAITQADAEMLAALKPQYSRLKQAQELLKAQGLPLAALPDFPTAPLVTAQPEKPTPAKQRTARDSGEISFVDDIAPLFNRSCIRCHGERKQEGEFNLSTFASLMTGGESGPAIVASEADNSKLYQLVRDKEMPPRRGLPDKDIALVEKWIAAGAKFDGDDEATTLAKLSRKAPTDSADSDKSDNSVAVDKPTDGDAVSFVKHVVPILLENCGNCHIEEAKGEFSIATFAELMAGGEDGPVFQAGNSADSSLYTLVSTKKMPPRKGLPADQSEIIKRWIDEGAQFDGSDEGEDLAALTPPSAAGESVTPEPAATETADKADEPAAPARPTGPTVSFSKQIAPIIVAKCFGCHTDEFKGGLVVETYTMLMSGGDSGEPIKAGNAADSLLYQLVESKKMPPKKPLSAEEIELIKNWIDQGAANDHPNPQEELQVLVGK
ncbi:MAG: hypothetical protein KDB23_10005 [Planctomycetales bacterium]|nr:hypothetical protein [Planctomycetales bacterium]